MTVKFWSSFSKRQNSTKQPTSGTETASLTCRLKEATSLHEPVIELSSNNFSYEYAYISDFGKYYFVRDVISSANGLVEYHLIEDTLTTYKTDIGNTYAHILYSSSGGDISIIDPRITVSNQRLIYVNGGTSTYQVFPSSNDYYILSVFNDHMLYDSGTGTVQDSGLMGLSYGITGEDLQNIREWLSRNTVMDSIEQYFHGEPIKTIFQCLWVPYDLSTAGVSMSTGAFHFGDQICDRTPTAGARAIVGSQKGTGSISVPLTKHYTDFRASEPYTTGEIYLPGVGVVKLNMGDWLYSNNVNVEYTIEYITGNVRYFLKTDGGTVLGTYDCNVASQCPLGQAVLNGGGVVNGLMGMGSSVAMLAAGTAAGGAGGAVAASALAIGAANTALAANKRDTVISGGIGGRMIQTQPAIYLIEYCVQTEDPSGVNYIAQRGQPYSGVAQISSLSGYVQCEGASVECSASALEKEEINNYLNNGFYYE